MKFLGGFTAIFIIYAAFNVISGDELTVFEANSFNNEINETFVTTSADFERIWGTINNDSVRIAIPMSFVRNASIGTIATWNVTYRVSRIMDGIRLRSVNNSGVGDIISGGIGYNFATFMLVGHSNFFTFIVESFENYTSSLITTTTPSLIPDKIVNEWGTVNSVSQILFPVHRWTGIAYPGTIFQENIRVDVQQTIDGIRLTSIENSVESGHIIDGGVGFNYVIVRVTSRENFLSCMVETFRNGTLHTTTPVPDYYVEHWGTVHSRSELLSDNRHYLYPTSMVMADRRITEYTDRTIHAMRLYALNGTRGAFAFIDGGLGHNFVTFRFVGESIGRGFDFRLELYNSAASKRLSVVLVLLSCLLYNILK